MVKKKMPMRQCIGCRESRPKTELIRIVRSECVAGCDDKESCAVYVDRTGKANGRGAYLCDRLECLQKARKNHGLDRAFKINIKDEIYDDLERQLSE